MRQGAPPRGPGGGSVVVVDATAGRMRAEAMHAELPLVLTTPAGARRLGGSAQGLAPYGRLDLTSDTGLMTVTAVPAEHGPAGAEAHSGPVTGFLLAGDGLPTVYVSGDNASLDVVRDIATHFGPSTWRCCSAGAPRYQACSSGNRSPKAASQCMTPSVQPVSGTWCTS